jgi:hypothetical protein
MQNQDITTGVWLFEQLVKNKPAKGSNDYPIAIKATHLDHNWKKTTLRAPKGVNPPDALYEVKYDNDGTYITRILPDGANTGDILVWNVDRWIVLEAPPSSETLYVLGYRSGVPRWVETQDCPE